MACELDRAPDLLVGRRRLDPLELPLQPLELAGKPRAAEEPQRSAACSSRSRRRSSWSVAIAGEQPEQAGEYVLSSGRGTIASMWPKRRFCSARPKSSGSFSRVVCWTTRGPVKDEQRARLGDDHVAEAREAREHAGRRRVCHDADHRLPASWRSSTAQTVFGSCISERIPSCMRAPPEAVTETSGTPRSRGAVASARRTSRRRRCPSSRP